MSSNSDHVSDSAYNGYQYDVEIQRVNPTTNGLSQKSRVYYNNLHLPVEEDELDKYGKARFVKQYTYNIDANPSNRSSSFSLPVSVILFSGDKQVSIESTTYNDYAYPILNQVSGIINNQWLTYRKTVSSYFEAESAYYLAKEIADTDTITGTQIDTKNSLTFDHKNLATSTVHYTSSSLKYSASNDKQYEYGYDSSGRVISERIAFLGIPPAGSSANSKIAHNYSYSNNILTDQQTDALNNITTTTYAASLPGAPVLSIISPSGKTITYSYDAAGRELSVTSAGGNTTTTKYHVVQDGSNINQVIKTDPLNHIVTITYDELSNPILVNDNGGINRNSRIIKQNQYNQLGQLTSSTDILGQTNTYKYDEFGRIVSSRDQFNNVVTVNYDDATLTTTTYLNKIPASKAITDSLGNIAQEINYSALDKNNKQHLAQQDYIYNGFGSRIKSNLSNDGKIVNNTSTTYDSEGGVNETTEEVYDNNLIQASINKDLLGNPLNINTTINTQPTNNPYNNTYNALGQLTSSHNSLGTKSMNYDADGNLKSINSYLGTTEYNYDNDNNIISQTMNGITLNKSYDANGNLLSVSDSSKAHHTIKYNYTNAGLLEKVTYPDGKTVSYTYYNNGLPKTKTNVFGVITSYEYDNHGRITNISTLDSSLSYK